MAQALIDKLYGPFEPGAVRGHLPRHALRDHQGQAQGRDDRGAGAREAEGGAGPDGGAEGEPGAGRQRQVEAEVLNGGKKKSEREEEGIPARGGQGLALSPAGYTPRVGQRIEETERDKGHRQLMELLQELRVAVGRPGPLRVSAHRAVHAGVGERYRLPARHLLRRAPVLRRGHGDPDRAVGDPPARLRARRQACDRATQQRVADHRAGVSHHRDRRGCLPDHRLLYGGSAVVAFTVGTAVVFSVLWYGDSAVPALAGSSLGLSAGRRRHRRRPQRPGRRRIPGARRARGRVLRAPRRGRRGLCDRGAVAGRARVAGRLHAVAAAPGDRARARPRLARARGDRPRPLPVRAVPGRAQGGDVVEPRARRARGSSATGRQPTRRPTASSRTAGIGPPSVRGR